MRTLRQRLSGRRVVMRYKPSKKVMDLMRRRLAILQVKNTLAVLKKENKRLMDIIENDDQDTRDTLANFTSCGEHADRLYKQIVPFKESLQIEVRMNTSLQKPLVELVSKVCQLESRFVLEKQSALERCQQAVEKKFKCEFDQLTEQLTTTRCELDNLRTLHAETLTETYIRETQLKTECEAALEEKLRKATEEMETEKRTWMCLKKDETEKEQAQFKDSLRQKIESELKEKSRSEMEIMVSQAKLACLEEQRLIRQAKIDNILASAKKQWQEEHDQDIQELRRKHKLAESEVVSEDVLSELQAEKVMDLMRRRLAILQVKNTLAVLKKENKRLMDIIENDDQDTRDTLANFTSCGEHADRLYKQIVPFKERLQIEVRMNTSLQKPLVELVSKVCQLESRFVLEKQSALERCQQAVEKKFKCEFDQLTEQLTTTRCELDNLRTLHAETLTETYIRETQLKTECEAALEEKLRKATEEMETEKRTWMCLKKDETEKEQAQFKDSLRQKIESELKEKSRSEMEIMVSQAKLACLEEQRLIRQAKIDNILASAKKQWQEEHDQDIQELRRKHKLAESEVVSEDVLSELQAEVRHSSQEDEKLLNN